MLEVVVDLLLYAAGAALIGSLVRLWRPELSWRLVAVYGLLAALFVAPALFTPKHQIATDIVYQVGPWAWAREEPVEVENGLLGDPVRQMLPFRALVRDRWLSGQVPLWAHELGTGQPLLGNAQSAPLAPLLVLALPVPPLRGMTVAVAWQMLLGMLLMHALTRALGSAKGPERVCWGAILAAVAFAWSTYQVAWAYHPHAMAAAWLPGLFLGIRDLVHRFPRAFAGLVACATGMALSGHPESLAHAAVGAGVVAGALVLRGRFDGTRRAALGRLAAAGTVAFALSAPAILPVFETVEESIRLHRLHHSEHTRRVVLPPPVSGKRLVLVVSPLAYGSPRDGNYEGPSNFNEAATGYVGLLPLVLAVAGAIVYRGRILAVLAGGVVALATALRVGPFLGLLTHLPLLEHGAHGRFRLLFVLAVALAAGLTLERWLEETVAGRRPLRRPAVLGVLAVAMLAVAWWAPPEEPWQRAAWLAALAGGVLGLAWGSASGSVRGPRRARALGLGVVAWTGLELFLLGVRYHPAVPPELDLSPPPAVAFLQAEMREDGPFRVLGEGWSFATNMAAYYGLWDPRVDDPASPWAATRFVAEAMTSERGPRVMASEAPGTYDAALHRFLGVRWVLTARGRRPGRDWRPGPKKARTWLWRLPRSGSLFFVPETVSNVGDREAARTRALGLEDPAAVAITEVPFPSVQQGEVTMERVPANGFELTVESPAGAVVTSSVSWAPGWRVVVEPGDSGEEEELEALRIHGAFLGFEAPPGRQLVRLRYEPVTWRPAWALFVLGVLGVLLGGRRWR